MPKKLRTLEAIHADPRYQALPPEQRQAADARWFEKAHEYGRAKYGNGWRPDALIARAREKGLLDASGVSSETALPIDTGPASPIDPNAVPWEGIQTERREPEVFTGVQYPTAPHAQQAWELTRGELQQREQTWQMVEQRMSVPAFETLSNAEKFQYINQLRAEIGAPPTNNPRDLPGKAQLGQGYATSPENVAQFAPIVGKAIAQLGKPRPERGIANRLATGAATPEDVGFLRESIAETRKAEQGKSTGLSLVEGVMGSTAYAKDIALGTMVVPGLGMGKLAEGASVGQKLAHIGKAVLTKGPVHAVTIGAGNLAADVMRAQTPQFTVTNDELLSLRMFNPNDVTRASIDPLDADIGAALFANSVEYGTEMAGGLVDVPVAALKSAIAKGVAKETIEKVGAAVRQKAPTLARALLAGQKLYRRGGVQAAQGEIGDFAGELSEEGMAHVLNWLGNAVGIDTGVKSPIPSLPEAGQTAGVVLATMVPTKVGLGGYNMLTEGVQERARLHELRKLRETHATDRALAQQAIPPEHIQTVTRNLAGQPVRVQFAPQDIQAAVTAETVDTTAPAATSYDEQAQARGLPLPAKTVAALAQDMMREYGATTAEDVLMLAQEITADLPAVQGSTQRNLHRAVAEELGREAARLARIKSAPALPVPTPQTPAAAPVQEVAPPTPPPVVPPTPTQGAAAVSPVPVVQESAPPAIVPVPQALPAREAVTAPRAPGSTPDSEGRASLPPAPPAATAEESAPIAQPAAEPETPPELMTPEDRLRRLNSIANERDRKPYEPLTDAEREGLVASGDIVGKGKRKGSLTEQGWSALYELRRAAEARRLAEGDVFDLAAEQLPVPADKVDTYGINLPPGYVREGDRYVYRPTPTTEVPPDDTQDQQGLPSAVGEGQEPRRPVPQPEAGAEAARPSGVVQASQTAARQGAPAVAEAAPSQTRAALIAALKQRGVTKVGGVRVEAAKKSALQSEYAKAQGGSAVTTAGSYPAEEGSTPSPATTPAPETTTEPAVTPPPPPAPREAAPSAASEPLPRWRPRTDISGKGYAAAYAAQAAADLLNVLEDAHEGKWPIGFPTGNLLKAVRALRRSAKEAGKRRVPQGSNLVEFAKHLATRRGSQTIVKPARAEAAPAPAPPAPAEQTIRDILDANERQERARRVPVQRKEFKYSDGQWHGLGVPLGVSKTGEERTYWVSQTRDGTTVGARYPTREAWQAAQDERIGRDRAEFEAALRAEPDRLAAQAEYWLKPKQEPAASAGTPGTRQTLAKPLGTGDARDDAELASLRKAKRARRPMTAMQETALALYEARAAADPGKWKEGDGVGYKVGRKQINRGFRVLSVDPETKQATIRQVGDTGLTTTGGNSDRIADQQVHVAELVRDRKYDRHPAPPAPAPAQATAPAATEKPTPAPPPAAEPETPETPETPEEPTEPEDAERRRAILTRIFAAGYSLEDVAEVAGIDNLDANASAITTADLEQMAKDAEEADRDAAQYKRSDDWYYSAVARTVDTAPMPRAPGGQWRAWLAKQPGVKQEELAWLGVNEWLSAQPGSVTREALSEFIRANQVDVREVVKGEPTRNVTMPQELVDAGFVVVAQGPENVLRHPGPRGRLIESAQDAPAEYRDAVQAFFEAQGNLFDSDTKFASYQLPGGASYRELLLTLAGAARRLTEAEKREYAELNARDWRNLDDDERSRRSELETIDQAEGRDREFQSTHFPEPNILAHVRFNERTDADGKRVLFIEEVQSDWHQKAREKGYKRTMRQDEGRRLDELNAKAAVREGVDLDRLNRAERAEWERLAELNDKALMHPNGVPDAPFKQSWPLLAMKRMIRWASENGFDRLAWTTGEQQAERYDLSHQVREVLVFKRDDGNYDLSALTHDGRRPDVGTDVAPDKLQGLVGKDLAAKIVAGEGTPDEGAGRWRTFSGVDLKVGGEGMKGFYDAILPAEVNKYVKKWGGRVGKTVIPTGTGMRHNFVVQRHGKYLTPAMLWTDNADNALLFYDSIGAQKWVDKSRSIYPDASVAVHPEANKQSPVHSLDITSAMRDAAMQGQPLFRRHQPGSDSGMKPGKLRAIVANIEDKLAGAPRAIVVNGDKELPRAVRMMVVRDKLQGKWAGLTHKGVVYLNAQRIPTARDATRTYMHEMVGHYGLQALLGPEAMDRFVRQAWRNADIRKRAQALMARHPGMARAEAVEEALAELAESGAQNSVLDRIIAFVQQVLRDWGVLPDDIPTTADIRGIIAQARQALERPAAPATGQQAPAMTAPAGARAAHDAAAFGAPRFSLAGKRAATAGDTSRAEAMEREGRARTAIWRETGWYRGVDGLWRFEVDDSRLRFRPGFGATMKALVTAGRGRMRIGDYVVAAELFAAYPQLRDTGLEIRGDASSGASYDAITNTIRLPHSIKSDDPHRGIEKIVVHEIQHAIQEIEGFARGGSPDAMPAVSAKRSLHELSPALSWAYGHFNPTWRRLHSDVTTEQRAEGDKIANRGKLAVQNAVDDALRVEQEVGQRRSYSLLAGEAEARVVSRRLDMTPEQRKAEPPWVTMETMLRAEGLLKEGQTPEDALIVRGGRGKAMSTPGAVTPEESRRFAELTDTLNADLADASTREAKQAALDKWIAEHPKEYAELEKMRADVLKRQGYNIGPVWRGDATADQPTSYPDRDRREHGVFTTPERSIAKIYSGPYEPRPFYVQGRKILDLTQDTREARKWVEKWAESFDDWTDRQSGEETTAWDVLESGQMFDYEGDWSSERWMDIQATAENDGYDAVLLPDYDSGIGVFPSVVALNNHGIKLAAPLALDDAGNLIAPDQWGDESSDDIRYSLAGKRAATPEESRRFAELTDTLNADLADASTREAKQAALDKWIAEHPKQYAELETMRADVLKRHGYTSPRLFRGSVEDDGVELPTSFEAGGGIFLTDSADVAAIFTYPREYGEVITSVYDEEEGDDVDIEPGPIIQAHVRMTNPLVLTRETDPDSKDFVLDTGVQAATLKAAQKAGHDGIVVKDTEEGVGYWMEEGTTYVVFRSSQVKLSDPLSLDDAGNLIAPDQWGDESSDDIRYARTEREGEGDKEPAPDVLTTREYLSALTDALSIARESKRHAPVDVGKIERTLATIQHFAEKVPGLYREFEAANARPDYVIEAEELLTEMNEDTGRSRLTALNARARKHMAQARRFKAYVFRRDLDRKGYRVRHDTKANTHDLIAPNGDVVDTFETDAEAWTGPNGGIAREVADYLRDTGDAEGAEMLRDYRHLTSNIYDSFHASMTKLVREAEEAGRPAPSVTYTADDGARIKIDMDVATARMGDLRGSFMPRLRDPGTWIATARSPGDKHLRKFATHVGASMWAAGMKQKGYDLARSEPTAEGLPDVGPWKIQQLPESIFASAGTMLKLEQQINEALDKMGKDRKPDAIYERLHLKPEWGVTKDGKRDFMLTPQAGFIEGLAEAFKPHKGRWYQKEGVWHFPGAAEDFDRKLATELVTQFETYAGRFVDERFAEALGETLGDIIRSHGARQRMLGRSDATGEDVWLGYERDPIRAVTLAIAQTAEAMGKHRSMGEMIQAIRGTDIGSWKTYKQDHPDATFKDYRKAVRERGIVASKQREAFEAGMALYEDMARNEEPIDRIVQNLRALAAFKCLAFRLSTSLVNVTALPTAAAAVLSAETNTGLVSANVRLTKAATDYTRWFLGHRLASQETRELLNEIHKRGWDNAQYSRETLVALRGKMGRVMYRATQAGMAPFAITERLNRGATILAAYRVARSQGMEHNDAMLAAKRISDLAHAVYSKANLPEWARGSGFPGAVGRSFYTFMNYQHNYLQLIRRYGVTRKQGWYLMVGAVPLGGITASPLAVVGLAIWNRIRKLLRDPDDKEADKRRAEQVLYDMIDDQWGETAGDYARFGLPGVLFGIDLSGSLRMGFGFPKQPTDLMGAPAAAIEDIMTGGGQVLRGQYRRAAETASPSFVRAPLQAAREYDEGVTTRAGKPYMYYGEYIAPTEGETAWSAGGFRPARLSKIRGKFGPNQRYYPKGSHND